MKLATKIERYVIEPKRGGLSDSWESFHATNPSSMRLEEFPYVFLAYRAGGDDDRFFLFDKYVWNSNMGLSILDERGEDCYRHRPSPGRILPSCNSSAYARARCSPGPRTRC